jgi:hypothetical protein
MSLDYLAACAGVPSLKLAHANPDAHATVVHAMTRPIGRSMPEEAMS